MSPPPKITRRALTLGGIAAAGAVVIAGAVYEVPKLLKHRASGRYAKIVDQLDNLEAAALVGKSVEMPTPDGVQMAEEAAHDLKTRLTKRPLSSLMAEDMRTLEGMVEAGGWVIPLSLGEICVLAAESV
jgi:hypothetical protein